MTDTVKKLGRLAERVVKMQPRRVEQSLMDEIVLTLRDGEKELQQSHAEIDDLQAQLLDLIADSKQAARVEFERLLADYHACVESNREWYWVDQIEDRIKALEFFPQASAATDWRDLSDRVAHRYGIDRRDVDWVRVTRRIGAFDYTEQVDGTVTRKDWRDE